MSKKWNNLFDDDYIKIHDCILKYIFICILFFIIISFLLFVLKKECQYQNIIDFINPNEAYLVVDSYIVEKIIDNNKIELDNVMYDYSVLKVTKEEMMYLVYIKFEIDELIVNTNKYSIKLDDESLYKYIIRIMKGV